MPGDTLLAHLGSGVFAWTNPGVHYVLEVESSEAEMELNRFQSVGRKVYTSPRVNEGVCDGKVCRFEFDGGSSLQSWFFALSVENGRKPAPKPRAVRYGAAGTYPAALDLNLVFLGKLTGYSTDSAQRFFAERLSEAMDSLYADAAVNVSLAGRSRGSAHPVAAYAKELVDSVEVYFDVGSWAVHWYNGTHLMLDADELARGWSEPLNGALDVIVVESIDDPGCVGISPMPGYSLVGGTNATVVVGVRTTSSSGAMVDNTIAEIAKAISHETGHFLGLRHTTVTWEDRLVFHDFSIHEDGLSDTPFDPLCDAGIASASASSRAYGTASKRLLPLRYEKVVRPDLIGLAMDESSCPDYNNLMFPYIVESDGTPTLSPSQGAIMRENLSALPR